MAKYYVGTCSFTEAGLLAGFYPKGMPPAERIGWYAKHFNVVEIDSSFYALPSERNSYLFAERTPDDFIIHFKAFGLLTKHPVQTKRLGRALSCHLPPHFNESNVKEAPPGMLATAFDMFRQALMPLKLADKLGLILFQYPPYFVKSDANMSYILECQRNLPDYRLAIEFRHSSWLLEDEREDTFSFLRENRLSYVSVDEPQFAKGTTIPPVAQATTDTAYVRFHGRNEATWFKRGISVGERFNYLYSADELEEWVPKLESLSRTTKEVHLMFNNCFGMNPVNNAKQLAMKLGALKDKAPLELLEQGSFSP